MLNDLFLLRGLFEVKDLAGTDLDVNGDIIIAVDNDEALKLEDNSVDGISVELAGDLISNNANVNSIKDGNGSRIIFDGTATQSITTAITLDGEVFENIKVQKPAGSLLNLTNNIQIEGDLHIQSGTLKFNGNYITFGTDAADSLIVEGLMDIDNATSLQSAILRMAGGSNLIVNLGGILRVVGISVEPAIVSGITGSFNFEVNSGGTIQAQNYKFEYMDSDGIELKDGAIIDPTCNFSLGTIDNIFPGGTGLNIGDISGSNQRIIIRNVAIPNNPGNGANNVTKSFSSDTLEFAKASGNFAGEEFDDDPNNLVEWSSALLTRIWTGQQNNRWAIAGNWSPSGIPADSENVIIPAAGNDPEINGNAECNDLLIRENGFLTVLLGRNLDVNGHLSIGDTITQTDGRLDLQGNASINVGGNYFKRNNARLIPNSSTIIFDGTEEQNISSGGVDAARDAFYNLTINKSSGSALLLDAILINGNFTVSSGIFNAAGFEISVSNSWLNSGTFVHGGNTVYFIALLSGPFIISTGSSAFNHVLIDADNDANTYQLGANVRLDGDLTINHGVLNATGYNLDVDGSLTYTKTFIAGSTINVGMNWTNSGTFTAGTGTVLFDGAAAQTISTGGTGSNRAFYNFIINKLAGTALLSSDLEVNGSLTINNGTFNSGARNIFVAQNWRNAGIWVQTGGAVTFDASSGGPYTIGSTGTGAFNDAIINANGLTYRLTSDIDINRNLTINAGIFQAQGNDLNVGGTWTNNGSYIPAGGTVLFDGAINQDINSGGTGFGKVFDHVTVQKSAGTLKINAPVKANGNFLINSGIFNMNNRNMNIAGSFVNAGVINNAATLTLDALSGGPYNFNGGNSPLNIVTINAPAITYNMNGNSIIYGNLTISAGNLILNGNDLTFGNANSDVISVGGLLDIDAGASLSMFNGSSLATNSGGIVRVVGASGNLASVTEQSSSGFYNFTVASGGTIHARYAKFENMGSSGINVQNNASIDAVNNFSDVQFDNGQAGGSMLTVGDITGANQRLDISNTSFLSNPGGGAYNVSHTSGSDTLNFIESQGPFSGEAFDNDNPGDNLILWTDLAITRVWDGSESSVWTTPDNWTDGLVPADSEDAYIPETGVSNEPNISGTVQCRNLSISSGRTVTISNGATLNLGGYLHNNGTFTCGTSSILRIAGNFDNVHGTLNDNSSTVIFDSSLTQTIMTGGVGNIKRFYNLQINKSGGSVLLNSELEVNNNFSIVAGTFDANGYAMTIANNWTNSASFLSSGNQVTFDAQALGPFTISSGGSPFHHILFNAGNDAYTHVLGSNLSATGNVTILHGILNTNGSNLDIDGNFTNSRTF